MPATEAMYKNARVRCDGLWIPSDAIAALHDVATKYATRRIEQALSRSGFFERVSYDQLRPTIFYSRSMRGVRKAYRLTIRKRTDKSSYGDLLMIADTALVARSTGAECGRCLYAFVLDALIDDQRSNGLTIQALKVIRKRMRPLPSIDPFRSVRKLLKASQAA